MNELASVAAAVLLAIGVGVVLLCACGLVRLRDAFDRLHVPGLAALLGPVAVAVSLAIAEGATPTTLRGALIVAVLLVTSPVLTHVTARAERIHRQGDLEVSPEEGSSSR